ncbi:hypothetical protein DBY68_018690 [Pseudocitrobacter sp. RIT415]|uniref:Ig-like domain-containing protein n=1 Tax=Pseudocitrobacter sp. RIT415 TaxID=2202163 RepID=UPI000D36E5CA|nr:Ig-like domain-containing protein [Pseudocitrobacter sp. RIT 415]RAU44285.1 hypothetical protein DBY68_018690 [Pseudocitrobacter sp. RIT 415]
METNSFNCIRENKILIKIVVLINIFFQICFPLAIVFTPAMAEQLNTTSHLSACGNPNDSQDNSLTPVSPSSSCKPHKEDDQAVTQQQTASFLQQGATLLSGKHSSQQLTQLATQSLGNSANEEVNRWLNGKGTARIGLNVDDRFSLKNSQFDLLLPLWEGQSDLLFTQNSLHRNDERTQSNLGFGLRHFTPEYMAGINTFLDYDWTEQQARASLGLEYFRDYLKISANNYQRLTNWKDSHKVQDYQVRPANGWDIRAQGYLPSYPQLGLGLSWEQYYGHQVALFGKDDRQRNPHAVSGKIAYTPIPLLTLNAEHRGGKSGAKESRLGLDINYQVGVPWRKQIDQNEVAALRTLQGSRYDLVDRNNDIVLEYRKKEVIRLKMEKLITGYSGERKPIQTTLTSKYGLKEMVWSGDRFIQNGGAINSMGGSWQLLLPAYQPGPEGDNTYTLTAVAIDQKNNRSKPASVQVTVLAPLVSIANSTIEPQKSALPADGHAMQLMTLTLRDADNKILTQPLSANDIHITLVSKTRGVQSATLSSVKPTSQSGQFQFSVTAGTQEEIVKVVPRIGDITLGSAEIEMVAALADEGQSTLTVTPATLAANGNERAEIVFVPKTIKGEFLSNLNNVTFLMEGVNKAKLHITPVDAKEDSYRSWISGTQAGEVTIYPVINGKKMSNPHTLVTFHGDSATAHVISLETDKKNVPADGKSVATLTTTVKDAQGNPVTNSLVKFTTDQGTLSSNEVLTDANGQARTQISSTAALAATISASAQAQTSSQQVTVIFTSDNQSQRVSSLVADRETAPADGKTAITLTATVQDANGNPIVGQNVIFSSDNGTLNISEAQTDNNGLARTQLTAVKAGIANVTAHTDIDKAGKTKSVKFVADESTAVISQLDADRLESTADGQSLITFTATLSDANGNSVSGAEIKFSTSLGQLSEPQGTSDANGQVKVSLLSFDAGSAVVVATSTSDTRGKSKTVNFLPDTSNALISAISADRTEAIANGQDKVTVTVTVTDPNNNPTAGIAVRLTSALGLVTPSTVISDASGHARVVLTSIQSGDISVTATTTSDRQGKSQVVHFKADVATAAISELTADKSKAIADSKDAITITAKLTDSNGNPVSHQTIKFSTNNGILSAAEATTDVNGKAMVTLTSSTSGTSSVVATTVTDTRGKRLDLNFSADPSTAAIDSLISNQDSALADGAAAIIFTATLKDHYGNPVAGQKVLFATSGGTLSNISAITDANGQGRVQLVSTRMGSVTVSATSATDPGGKQKTVIFKANAATAKIDTLTASRDSGTANGLDKITLTATLKDAMGNPVPGESVVFSQNLGALSAPGGTSDQNGQVSVDITSVKSGSASVSATSTTDPSGKSITIQFVADTTTAAVTLLDSDKASAPADGKTAIALTATVQDAHGNTVPSVAVRFISDKGALSASEAMTDRNGLAHVTVTSTQDGPLTVTATTLTVSAGKSKTLNFYADASTAVVATLLSDRNTLTADGKSMATLTATLKDAHGNRVPNTVVTVSTTLGKLSVTQTKTDAQGEATFTLTGTTAGDARVSAITDSDKQGKTAQITFNADATSASITKLIADRDRATANGSAFITLTATVEDAFGNPVPAQTIHFTTDRGNLSATSAISNDRGQAVIQISSLKDGVANVVASHANDPQGKRIALTFVGDISTAKVTSLTPDRTSATADGRMAIALTALVTDVNNNPVPAANVSFSATDGNLSSQQAVTDDKGLAVVRITALHAGGIVVTAKADADANGQQASLTFVADSTTASVQSLTADRSEATADGKMLVTLTALLHDANGNPVKDETVHFTSDAGQLSGSTATTDTHGEAVITLSSRQSGMVTVKASSATDVAGKTAGIKFIADKTTAAVASLTADRDTITADGKQAIGLTALVQDANGNPVEGNIVTFTSVKGKLSKTTATTDNLGQAYVQITSVISGQDTVSATNATDSKGKSKTLVYTADKTTARIISLTPDNTEAIADGKDAISLSAIVKDANGNLIPALSVTFASTGGALNATSVDTNAQGVATVKLTSLAASSIVVKATSDNDVTGKQAQVTFMPDASTATISALKPDRQTALADGKAAIGFTAYVIDANKNPVPGISIGFSTTKGMLSAGSGITDIQGHAWVELRSLESGNATVKASTANDATGVSSSVNFDADASTAKVTSFTADRYDATANGKDNVTLSAKLQDINGNPVSGVEVSFITSLGNLNTAKAMTRQDGIAQVVLNSTKIGGAKVTAVSQTDANGKQLEVQFSADSSTARVTSLTSSATEALANGKESILLTATLMDALGNPVSATEITFASNLGALEANSVITDKQGLAQTRIISTRSGSATVSATARTDNTGQNITLAFNADASTASVISLTGDKQKAVANGKDAIKLTAILADAHGNRVANAPVSFTTSRGVLSQTQMKTDANGAAQITISSIEAGLTNINAKSAQDIQGSDLSITFEADKTTARMIALDTSSDSAIADGKMNITLTATIADKNGNRISGATVFFNTDGGTLGANQVITNIEGKAEVLIGSTKSGVVNVTAGLSGSSVDKTRQLTFNPDSKTAIVSTLTSDIPNATADGKSEITLTATIKDANGNRVPAVELIFAITDGQLNAQTGISDANGEAKVILTSTLAKTITVTARTKQESTGKKHDVQFNADISTATITALETDSPSIVADGKAMATLTVTVEDAWHNPVPNVLIALSTPLGTLAESRLTTNSLGQAQTTFSSVKSGEAQITARSVVGANSIKTVMVTLVSDSLTARVISLTADKTAMVVSDTDGVTLSAVVQDANGNPVEAQNVTFESDAAEIPPLNGTTDSSGHVSVLLVNTKAIATTLTAKIATDSQGQSVSLTFSPGEPSKIHSYSKTEAEPGEVLNWEFSIQDKYGNDVPGRGIVFTNVDAYDKKQKLYPTMVNTLLIDGNNINKRKYVTDANGRLTVQVKGTPGYRYLLTVTSNNVPATTEVIFYTLTSPDSAEASLYGHMPETITVDGVTFMRPPLQKEAASWGQYVAGSEVWATDSAAASTKYCTSKNAKLPSKDELISLIKSGEMTKNGWPKPTYPVLWSSTTGYVVNVNTGIAVKDNMASANAYLCRK